MDKSTENKSPQGTNKQTKEKKKASRQKGECIRQLSEGGGENRKKSEGQANPHNCTHGRTAEHAVSKKEKWHAQK
jgi:hypothetical protein